MSRFKFWLLVKLLKWFCSKELDQWELWRVDTKHGKVYITISRMPEPNTKDEAYDKI